MASKMRNQSGVNAAPITLVTSHCQSENHPMSGLASTLMRMSSETSGTAALVASPVMRAMADGKIARVEELTRIPADVQDTLITILSEKTLPIP